MRDLEGTHRVYKYIDLYINIFCLHIIYVPCSLAGSNIYVQMYMCIYKFIYIYIYIHAYIVIYILTHIHLKCKYIHM